MQIRFYARVVSGAGRGKGLGIPTLNLDVRDVPKEMKEGIYACWVTADNGKCAAALHYGPRPVFKDDLSCEVHLLDIILPSPPLTATVNLIERIRDVRDFADAEALKAEIARDIAACRAILRSHAADA